MPSLVNDGMASGYSEEYYSFGQSQAAASQSAVALKRNVNAATGGSLNITGVPMPHAGGIVGVTIATSANKTAGVATVTPTINGTALAAATGLAAVALANAAAKKVQTIDAQVAGARFKPRRLARREADDRRFVSAHHAGLGSDHLRRIPKACSPNRN